VIKLLLNHEAKTQITDKNGNNLLHLSTKNGQKALCELFLENGLELEGANND